MISLDEYNRARLEGRGIDLEHVGNNIACPECGAEMKDKYTNQILCSMPPQISVECMTCGFESVRIA